MTVRDLLELFTEDYQLVELWSWKKQGVVMRGIARDIMETKYRDWEINSIDYISNATTIITLNID